MNENRNPWGREYSRAEIAAAKRLGISETGPHAHPGPLYFAGGPYWPDAWRQMAADYALVSAAVDREWGKEASRD
jgi:hypothetical protein